MGHEVSVIQRVSGSLPGSGVAVSVCKHSDTGCRKQLSGRCVLARRRRWESRVMRERNRLGLDVRPVAVRGCT